MAEAAVHIVDGAVVGSVRGGTEVSITGVSVHIVGYADMGITKRV
jgi:hypothetical protein